MEENQPVSVRKAEEIILREALKFPVEEVNLKECTGRILMEDIYADNDFPPFDRVMMDGIAIRHKALMNNTKKFKIAGLQAAGTLQQKLVEETDCIEVMTGAMLPIDADTIIPYEKVTIKNGSAVIIDEETKAGQHIHRQGSDHRREDKLLDSGCKISPAEVSVLATVGKYFVKVLSRPKIAIVSTGDELVEVNKKPAPHQIRKSNSYALLSALEQEKLQGDLYHLPDKKEEVFGKLKELLQEYDVLLISGGVSKGKKDYLPEVLKEIEIEILIHRVTQRPGKPFLFGRNKKSTIFGFPGNPISTFLCFYRYFLPWYRTSAGLRVEYPEAVLKEDFEFKPALTYFLQVKLEYSDGKIFAIPVPGHGSGDLTNLTVADGFIELPFEKDSFTKGSAYPLIRYRY